MPFRHPLIALLLIVSSACTLAADPKTSAHRDPAPVTALLDRALSLLGVAYRRGGDDAAEGLDCSGFVRLVFAQSLAVELRRRARDISRHGRAVARDDLRPGDLVFFDTLHRTFSHVGIYLGGGAFVHAPAAGGEVRVESLSLPYWRTRFSGARRITGTI